MNTLYLEYFIEIADQHSINKAAKKLMLNRSSLNVAMKALEGELGYALFSRSPKGVELTANGKQIYQDTKNILNTIQAWHGLRADQKLTLNFYVVPAINNIFSVALLSSYRKQNKSVEFHCFEITNSIDSIEPTLSKDNVLILGGHYTRDRQRLYSLASKKNS